MVRGTFTSKESILPFQLFQAVSSPAVVAVVAPPTSAGYH
jgi:hypothetical protein